MKHIRTGILFFACLLSVFNADGAPLEKRARSLRSGVNISDWFIYEERAKQLSTPEFKKQVEADARQIRALGFDHVKICIDPEMIGREARLLSQLRMAVQTLSNENLSVVLDLHPAMGADRYADRLMTNKTFRKKYEKFLETIAQFLKTTDPEKTFLTVLNEPMTVNLLAWSDTQRQLVQFLRARLPQHTLIVTGAPGATAQSLIDMPPLPDPNLIYSFHFYEPGVFTHQGAKWGASYNQYLSGVPFPFDQAAYVKTLVQIPSHDVPAQSQFRSLYENQVWNTERLEGVIQTVGAWAKKNQAVVVCGEFGVTKTGPSKADRYKWIRETRTALERHGIGWTFWSYRGAFGIINQKGALESPDEEAQMALGTKK